MRIIDWVNQPKDQEYVKFRKAIHLILLAISRDKNLSHTLILKGGIVMSLVYGGSRYTSDLDASILLGIEEITPEKLQKDLERQLKVAEIELGYGLAFNIHSIKLQPAKKFHEVKYPAYNVKIGYAETNNPSAMKRLQEKQSPSIVDIDISFNESVTILDTECFELGQGRNVLHYSLEQIMAEKYRGLLQQPVRKRTRRQDVYDIYFLLENYSDHFQKDETKKIVLAKLKKSSENKGIDEYLHQNGILDESIKQMAFQDFETLELEIDIEKVEFDVMFGELSSYFQSLPW